MDFLIDLPWHHQATATKLGSCQHRSFAMGTPPFFGGSAVFLSLQTEQFPHESRCWVIVNAVLLYWRARERNAAVNHAFSKPAWRTATPAFWKWVHTVDGRKDQTLSYKVWPPAPKFQYCVLAAWLAPVDKTIKPSTRTNVSDHIQHWNLGCRLVLSWTLQALTVLSIGIGLAPEMEW